MVVIVMLFVTENNAWYAQGYTKQISAFQIAKLSSPVACAVPLRFVAPATQHSKEHMESERRRLHAIAKTNREKAARRREVREAAGKAKTAAPVEPQVPRMPVPRGTVATATKSPASRDPSVRTRKQSGSPGAPSPIPPTTRTWQKTYAALVEQSPHAPEDVFPNLDISVQQARAQSRTTAGAYMVDTTSTARGSDDPRGSLSARWPPRKSTEGEETPRNKRMGTKARFLREVSSKELWSWVRLAFHCNSIFKEGRQHHQSFREFRK